MTRSVCVLGAGIGGLTTAAYLTLQGYRVTVLEKARTVGGSAGWYIRKGRMFPTGATIAFGLEERGLLRMLLNDLGIPLQANKLMHPMDVILSSQKVSIYQDTVRWEEELKRAFPDRRDKVIRFWRELDVIAHEVEAITQTGISLPARRLYDLGKMPNYVIRHPLSVVRLSRYAFKTVEDLLKKYQLEQEGEFVQLLNAQLLDAAQTDVAQAALLPSSLALTIYRRGSFDLKNGLGTICHLLAERITALGGEVILKSPVKSVTYHDQFNKWEIESTKQKGSFDIVVNNTGVSFGPHTSYADQEEFSWGAFRLDAIIKEDIWYDNDKPLPFAYQIIPDESEKELLRDGHGPIYVTLHHAKDKNGKKVEGELMMTASVHTESKKWTTLDKEAYKKKKDEMNERLLSIIEKVIPLKENLLWIEAGSPATYKRFVGKSEVGGFPLTVKNAIWKPKSYRSKLSHFYIVGEQVFPGPGTLSAALSGYYAARAIHHDFPLR